MPGDLSLQMGRFKDGMLRNKIAYQMNEPGSQATRVDPKSKDTIEKFIVIVRSSLANIGI